jgi:hypothetical protein
MEIQTTEPSLFWINTVGPFFLEKSIQLALSTRIVACLVCELCMS